MSDYGAPPGQDPLGEDGSASEMKRWVRNETTVLVRKGLEAQVQKAYQWLMGAAETSTDPNVRGAFAHYEALRVMATKVMRGEDVNG